MNHEEFHSFISAKQENICQITALKNGIMIINDTWHDYKTTDLRLRPSGKSIKTIPLS